MSFVSTLLLLACCLCGAVYLYLAHTLGSNSLHATYRLLQRGCVRLGQVSWRAGIQGLAVVQPERLGGATIFTAESVKFRRIGTTGFLARFNAPCANFKGNQAGMLYLVALLQDVGFLKEAKAHETPAELQDDPILKPPALLNRAHHASFEGEAHVAFAHLVFRQGQLDLPYEVGQMLGASLKAVLAAGTGNVRRCSSKLGWEEGWWERRPVGFLGRLRYPVLLRLESETAGVDLTGWRCDTGLRLWQPIACSVLFTPEIAQLMLCRLHPLLGSAVRLQGSEALSCSLTPVDLHLPAEMVSLRLEPLKLILQTKALVKGLFKLLNTLGIKEWEDPRTMVAWTSAIEADVYRSGLLVSKRMDVLLGHKVQDSKGLHLCMWGSVNANTNLVKMTLGIPAGTLSRLGARVPPDFCFCVPIGGTSQAPKCDWLRAGKDLAELLVKGRLQEGLPALGRVFQRKKKPAAAEGGASEVPPAHHPLPWEAFEVEPDKGPLPAKPSPETGA